MYQSVATVCFRFFGFHSFAEVDNLTMRQYKIMLHALRLRQVDESYKIHQLAYLTQVAGNRKGKKQEPVYRTFRSFFNYEEALEEAEHPEQGQKRDRFVGLREYLRQQAKEKEAKRG